MKLLLHIGMSKAGSSAIQQMLHDSRPALARHGICYPLAGIEGIHAHFGIHHDLIHRDSVASLERALAECAGSRLGLLSCEAFWVLPPGLIARLAVALRGIEVEVVLYLRSPRGYLPSSYRQAIRHHGTHRSFRHYLTSVSPRLDYPRLLTEWARHFPLRVRVYDRVRGSLCRDFCTVAGLPVEALAIPSGQVNTTPCDGAMRTMRAVNTVLPRRVSARIRRAIVAHERWFAFLPALDDSPADAAARTASAAWDVAVLRRYLSDDDIAVLRSGAAGGTIGSS